MKRFSTLMSLKKNSEEESKVKESIQQQQQATRIPIHIIGPRKSGKTTFLYKAYFKYNNHQETDTQFNVIPTPTSNVEVIDYKHYQFEVWDFAEINFCLNHIRDTFTAKSRIIIYMVDSVEYGKETVATKVRENMVWLLENCSQALKDTIIITAANKLNDDGDVQDIGLTWTTDTRLLGLLRGHDWRIFPCNAASGQGLDTIFEYIVMKLEHQQSMQQDAVTPWESLPNPHHLNDHEFFVCFQQGRPFLFFDHPSLVRVIYLTIVTQKKHQLLLLHEQLKDLLLAISDESTKSIRYSDTQTLFWIHMVSFALLKSPLLEGENNDFDSFQVRCASTLEEDCWKHYYSHKVFYSERATYEFLPPDKKPLPNAFRPSSLALKGSGLRIDYQVL
ncbi:MAG: P-loop containing nucleoside triphosphate hydrolase protein [Benjaminiella poitrasii]|nr:MAG: P-loop containing nucleoside triphosphate hydrolase protein [Benjaminiella poitrasii]